MEDQVTLDVRDDGVGIAATNGNASAGGFGLDAMRQRIASVSGTLTIESERGGGTAVSASVPVSAGGPE
jgi:signal transduction histidine kinase